MYKIRHYVLVWQGNGTVSLCVRWFGPFDRTFLPIQMLDPRGWRLPQPYPDQPGIVRDRRRHHNADVWFVNMQDPPPQFRWEEITAEQYGVVAHNPLCWEWNGTRLALRPGHIQRDILTPPECRYQDYLKRTHFAFGGMPIYQVRHWAKKTPEDFPEILAGGMFRERWREWPPLRLEIHPELRPRTLDLADVRALTPGQRHRLPITLAVTYEIHGGRPTLAPVNYVTGRGAN